MNAPGIRRIAVIVVGAALLIGATLWHLMIDEHEAWLERSYMNRWAFRDVPTRRGSILDARGTVIATDVPGFDLELDYRTFRRRHPLAAAVHGANLCASLQGLRESFEFRRVERMRAALRVVLEMPVTWLSEGPFEWRAARDLRFYASSVVAAFTGRGLGEISLELWRAAESEWPGSVRDAVAAIEGWRPVDFERLFDERIAELDLLGGKLAVVDPELDLWAILEERRADSHDWHRLESCERDERAALLDAEFWRFLSGRGGPATPREWFALDPAHRGAAVIAWRELDRGAERDAVPGSSPVTEPAGARAGGPRDFVAPVFRDEARPRIVRARLPYGMAAWLGMLGEHHPGLLLRPAVQRELGHLPDGLDLGSFAPYVGRVTPYWAQDGEQIVERDVDRVAEATRSQRFLEQTRAVVPAVLEDSFVDDFEATLRRHYRHFGRLGRGGVEQQLNAELAGMPGLRLVERDKRARERQLFESLDVTPGRDVQLTIDLRLQQVVERTIADLGDSLERALVVVDPHSGDVLALAGRTVDIARGSYAPEWSFAATWPNGNPNVGSVVKPFVLLEHLEACARDTTLAGPGTFRPCTGRERFGGRVLSCSHVHGDLSRDPVAALAESCNFYYYQAIASLGDAGLDRALARVGWTRDPAADPRAWQDEVRGLGRQGVFAPRRSRGRHQLELQSIGYGVWASALFVARGYAAIATGALPTLGLVVGEARSPAVRLDAADEHLELVRAGLRECVATGTAAGTGLARFGVHGKTGTAEILRRSTDGGLVDAHNAWFAGYVGEGERSSLAFCAVAYGDPGSGGRVAGVLVERFLAAVAADPLLRDYLVRNP